MDNPLTSKVWRGIRRDERIIHTGPKESTHHFFELNEDINEDTISKIQEPQLLEYMFEDRVFVEHFFEALGSFSHCSYLLNVPRKRYLNDGKAGDFDLLLLENSLVQRTVCFEFKLLRINAKNTEYDDEFRLKELLVLKNQVSDRLKLGFYKTFACIVISSDLRSRDFANSITKSITYESMDKIYRQIMEIGEFPSDAGVLYVRVSQPTGKSYTKFIGYDILLDRVAVQKDQSKAIESASNELFKKYKNGA